MNVNYRTYEPWCPTAVVQYDNQLFIPHFPDLVAMVEAVDEIIYRMIRA